LCADVWANPYAIRRKPAKTTAAMAVKRTDHLLDTFIIAVLLQ